MKKVLLIDPWGINSTGDYTKGLIHGLAGITELSVVTNYYFKNSEKTKYTLYKWFFKKTEEMERSKIRSVFRGLEYYQTYSKILKLIDKEKYDVVHINWLLMYKIDIYFLKKMKNKGVKLVYTAHNVLPHVNGEKNIKEMKAIYSLVDRIIVHGELVKKEFGDYFPEYKDKIYVQKHGCNLKSNINFKMNMIDPSIVEKFQSYDRRFIFFGNIFYNKGVDILFDFWNRECKNANALLIVAGKKREAYKELDELEKEVCTLDNVLYLNRFVEDDLLNFMITNSDLILLPYRHASMSGVVFTAADFKKAIMCTATGALEEYLCSEEDSFVVKDTEEFVSKLMTIIETPSRYDLQNMGEKLYQNIHRNCNWMTIAKKMSDECYY